VKIPDRTTASAFLRNSSGEVCREIRKASASFPTDGGVSAVFLELTEDDLQEIDTAAAKLRVQGARYPERLEKMTGR
jgi:hypothetical protein